MSRILSIEEVEMGVGDHTGGGDLVQEKKHFQCQKLIVANVSKSCIVLVMLA